MPGSVARGGSYDPGNSRPKQAWLDREWERYHGQMSAVRHGK